MLALKNVMEIRDPRQSEKNRDGDDRQEVRPKTGAISKSLTCTPYTDGLWHRVPALAPGGLSSWRQFWPGREICLVIQSDQPIMHCVFRLPSTSSIVGFV